MKLAGIMRNNKSDLGVVVSELRIDLGHASSRWSFDQ